MSPSENPQNSSKTPPLLKADMATLSFYATKDGKVSVSYPGWDDRKVVLLGQAFEIVWRPQGVEGRIRAGEGPDPRWPRLRVAVSW